MAKAESGQAKLVAQSIIDETGGGYDALRERSLLHFTQKVRAATLILNGAMDDRTDPEQARRLADEINSHKGSARVIIYPEYGHQIPVGVRDRVIDQFIRDVLGR